MKGKKVKRGLRQDILHRVNGLHVYCRLCYLTKNKKKAQRIAGIWERTILYLLIYGRRRSHD